MRLCVILVCEDKLETFEGAQGSRIERLNKEIQEGNERHAA